MTRSLFPDEPSPLQRENKCEVPHCDLCSSPRAWLRIEEREGFGMGQQSIRIFEVGHPENFWESPGADSSVAPTRSYDVCSHGHVRESMDSPGGSGDDRIKVCLLGPVGGGKSQLRETLLRIQAPIRSDAGGGDDLVRNARFARPVQKYSPAGASDRESIGATRAASGEDMRTTIETGLQRLPGRGGAGDVLAGFEKVLRDAIRATPEGRALSAEDVDARVGDWGWGRPPYLRPVRVEYSNDNREGERKSGFDVAFVDLPGEATDAWTSPGDEHYVGSQADVVQLCQSAHYLAVIDPLAADWCLDSLKDSPALDLSLRAVGAPDDAQGRWRDLEARGRLARDATEDMIAVMTDTMDEEESVGATIVLTKCDAIRALLARTPESDDPLGRWAQLVPAEDHEDFRECARTALLGCERSWTVRSSDPATWDFLSAVVRSGVARQMEAVARLLSQFSDPDRFWALAHSGAAVEVPLEDELATAPMGSTGPQDRSGTRVVPGASFAGALTVPTSGDTWYSGLGAQRLQMRDVMSAVVVSAILSTMVRRNDLEQLLGQREVRFALASAWTRVDRDGRKMRDRRDDDAGCLQVFRHILAPFLGHGGH